MSSLHFIKANEYAYACEMEDCDHMTARGTKNTCQLMMKLHYKVKHKGVKCPANYGKNLPDSGTTFKYPTAICDGIRSLPKD